MQSISALHLIAVMATTAITAYLAHHAMAVFHDGVRPIVPEFTGKRMKRAEFAAVSFGLSAGFIFGYGIPLSLSTGLLNPWLLFLPTDVLGIMSPNPYVALAAGALWGGAALLGLQTMLTAAKALPVDMLTPLNQFANPVIFMFSLFPVIAIAYQFGRMRAFISLVIVVLARVLLARYTTLFPEAFTMALGVLLLVFFAVQHDRQARRTTADATVGAVADDFFSVNAARIRKNLVYLAAAGALIAVLANFKIFAGSEVSIFPLKEGKVAAAAQADFYRGLGFVPMIATTALASGAYQIVGLTFIYPVGYLSPNPVIAALGGAAVIAAEVLLLFAIARGLTAFPSIRDSSDHIRNAINQVVEIALLFGALMAGNQMAEGLGIILVGGLYALNEALGRPVIRLAAGPAAAIVTGVILNVLYYLHLFTPPAAS